MSMSKITSNLPKVIARSFEDEPVILWAHALDQQANRVFVGILEAKSPLSLSVDDVFDYDERSFTSLREAFTGNNKTELAKLYSQLGGKSPCNRYQYVLSSLHEKPEITNTRSSADSG
jgi:hypothetical protein